MGVAIENRVSQELAALLDREAERINTPAFIEADPVQFPRRFERLEDIEIVSLLSAIIAWGNRKMICRDIERLLDMMEHSPYDYVMERGYEEIPQDMNIHRTLFGRHLVPFLRGLRQIYAGYGSLDAFSQAMKCGEGEAPSWLLAERMQQVIADENGGERCSQCIPGNLGQTALKRINMALRWLVRDDGIVDMGVWRSIPKSRLFIPLDVHVGNVSRRLGLLQRKSNDRKAVEQLTAVLRTLRPDDPVYYDYALFGVGVENGQLD